MDRIERLREVAAAWEDLWNTVPAATPFTSPMWLLPFCEHLLTAEPWALLAWRGDALAAVLPSFVYDSGGSRVLGLLGGGVSDYQDVLADGPAAVDALLLHLASATHRFDVIAFEALPPDSLLVGARAPLRFRAHVGEVCPTLALPRSFDQLADGASAGLLGDVRYQRRRLAREGAWEIVEADERTWGTMLVELFRLHRARWNARGEPGVLAGAGVAAFHRDASRGLLSRGMLRTYALVVRGTTIGVLHGFAAHGRTYAYLPAMAPAAGRYSPGSLLFAHAIERAIAEGCGEFDFLRGSEPYKYRWGAVDRWTSTLTLSPQVAAQRGFGEPAAPTDAPTG